MKKHLESVFSFPGPKELKFVGAGLCWRVTYCWRPSLHCRVFPTEARCASWQGGRFLDGLGLRRPARLCGRTEEEDSSWETCVREEMAEFHLFLAVWSEPDKKSGTYCEERLSLGEVPWHGKRQSSRSDSARQTRAAVFLKSIKPKVSVSDEHSRRRSPTWQRRLRLAQQRRRRWQTAEKRLCGAPTVGGAGAWMDLKDNQHQSHTKSHRLIFHAMHCGIWTSVKAFTPESGHQHEGGKGEQQQKKQGGGLMSRVGQPWSFLFSQKLSLLYVYVCILSAQNNHIQLMEVCFKVVPEPQRLFSFKTKQRRTTIQNNYISWSDNRLAKRCPNPGFKGRPPAGFR